MPATYRIDSSRRLVEQFMSGKVEFAEALTMLARMRQDPLFDPKFDVIVDASGMTATDISFQAISQAASSGALNPFSKESRCAVVAPGELAYGMARMYEAVRRGGEYEIFRSISEAQAWLVGRSKAEAS